MSRSTTIQFTCPCGETFSSQVYEYVNIAKDPQLLYIVLAGLLNVSTCPNCGRRAVHARPFIYSDPARHLLAYVHPRTDLPDEARMVILEKLQDVYDGISGDAEGGRENRQAQLTEQQLRDLPPLQVIFGLDQLNAVINAVLSQEERLGKLALNTQSRDEAERAQILHIARKLASDMQCQVEVEDMPDEYTVWLYGSRRQIGAIMRELATR
jgi:CpXC protein